MDILHESIVGIQMDSADEGEHEEDVPSMTSRLHHS